MLNVAWISSDYFDSLLLPQLLRGENDEAIGWISGYAKWAVNILRELLCIWSDWKSLSGLNVVEDIYIKFRETKLVEIL